MLRKISYPNSHHCPRGKEEPRAYFDDVDYATKYFKEKSNEVQSKPSVIKQSAVKKPKQEFDELINVWVDAIKYQSLESQQIKHPAFLRIIAIGSSVMPYIFEEFSKRPFVAWFRALEAITGERVASKAETFGEAVELWLEWGRQNNYLKK